MAEQNQNKPVEKAPAPDAKAKKEKKKKKPKGPIRFEAVIPFCIFVALIYVYFALFFDTHIRKALEYVGTQANGAEVNIAKVDTSFFKASLEISDIQVTSVEEPAKNKVQIGSVRWNMLWDALLRGKVAIEEASINDVMLAVPRKKPGYVVPPPPPGDPNEKSQMDKLKEQALNEAQEEFNKNVLGDVASLLSGTDPADQIKNIEGALKSSLRIKELQTELEVKKKEWQDRLNKLPQANDFKALQDRLKAVKLDGFSNPGEVQQSVQQLDAIFRETDAKIKEVKATADAVGSDTNKYQNSFKELEAMVQQDIKDLESRFKIPKVDAESLSRMLFGPQLLNRVKGAEGYMNKARAYMPPKKSKEEKAEFKKPVAHERSKGRNYKFGRPKSYPLFWLKLAKLNSKSTPEGLSGDLSGQIVDVTDDPPILGRPMIASFKGDFPKQNVFKVDGELVIDHVTERAREALTLKVGQFGVVGQNLVNSNDVQLAFDKADGSTQLKVELVDQSVDIQTNSVFSNIGYQVAAKQPILQDILKGVVADVPRVTADAGVKGTWSSLDFNIDTNLGREIGKGFEKQLQLKIEEARAKIKALIDTQIGAEKAKLTAEFNKVQDQIKGVLKQKEDEGNKIKGSVDKAKNDSQKEQTRKIEQQGKDALEDLKKKFKF